MQNDPTALAVTEAEHDTLAWLLTTLGYLGRDAALELVAAWQPAVFDYTTPPDGDRATLTMPAADRDRHELAELLRELARRAGENRHRTGMVFYLTARQTAELAARIDPPASHGTETVR